MSKNTVLSENFNDLKNCMKFCHTVDHWNRRREAMKELFSHELICQLDASGFIKTLNLNN